MFTRTMFCELCAEKHRPQEGQFFVLYGKDHNTFYKHRVDKHVHVHDMGYTPHLISVLGHDNGTVRLEVTCSMNGCGVQFGKQIDDTHQQIIFLRTRNIELPEKEFKSLYEFKNNGYEI